MKFTKKLSALEQTILLFAAFVWTVIICGAPTLVFFYQNQSNHTNPLARTASQPVSLLAPPQPTTSWAYHPTTAPVLPPTPTATRVVPLPETLPEMPDAPELTPQATAPPQAEVASLNTGRPAVALPSEILAPPPTLSPLQHSVMPTKLVINSVAIDSEVVPVGWHTVEREGRLKSIWQVVDNAVGWHQTSAVPGQTGNTVLVAHSNSGGEVFRNLDKVQIGDTIVVDAGNQQHEYIIEFTTIVKEAGESPEVRRDNAKWIAPTNDNRLTLVTCWPYPRSTHRLIVVARPK